MEHEKFIEYLRRRMAQISVSASALRKQGAPGIINICRNYFEHTIDLKEFIQAVRLKNYLMYLNNETDKLLERFPDNGKSWGAARKGLNLFFREVAYNLYFANHLGIPSETEENKEFLRQLEVPLDKDVATSLMNKYHDLPKWKSIKELTPDQSNLYQKKADEYAAELMTARVHLDLIFWRKPQENMD